MKEKDIKKVITLSAPVVALAIGAGVGLTDAEVMGLQEGLIALGSAALGIAGVFGVFADTNKKKTKK